MRFAEEIARLVDQLYDFVCATLTRNAAVDTIETAIHSLSKFSERGRPPPRGGLRELRVAFGEDGYVPRYGARSDEVIILRIFHARERRS